MSSNRFLNRWIAVRCAWAAAVSVLCGGVVGALNALTFSDDRPGAGDLTLEVLGGVLIFGAILGLLLSPACMFVTTSRRPLAGTLVVVGCSAAAGAVSGAAGHVLLAPAVVFVASCAWWRLASGDGSASRIAGRCASCGYALDGLTTPTCPECGEAGAT